MNIAIATSERGLEMSPDDPILLAALEREGHRALHWCWDDADAAWANMDLVIIRSTWDYFERPDEFRSWIANVEAATRLANPSELLLWNFDKSYLLDLEDAGVPIIPTRVASGVGIAEAIAAVHAEGREAIAKPCVSGGAWGLHHILLGQEPRWDVDKEPYLVQPFLPSIREQGEVSLIYVAGALSHVIAKLPRPGDIRVQREFGGAERVVSPEPGWEAVARQALAACPGGVPLYARVDLAFDGAQVVLMELEGFEPELFLAKEPECADRLAQAVVPWMSRCRPG